MASILHTKNNVSLMLERRNVSHQTMIKDLLPLVYDELYRVAHRQLACEYKYHSLSTTELVNEAYIKLARSPAVSKKGRAYFFAAAAHSMRQVLVDYARHKNRHKRNGWQNHITLNTEQIQADDVGHNIIELDDALKKLSVYKPRYAQVVECRFFSGLSVEETAAALEVSTRTVKQDWAMARAWLYRKLHND